MSLGKLSMDTRSISILISDYSISFDKHSDGSWVILRFGCPLRCGFESFEDAVSEAIKMVDNSLVTRVGKKSPLNSY